MEPYNDNLSTDYTKNPFEFFLNFIISKFNSKDQTAYYKAATLYANCFILSHQDKMDEAKSSTLEILKCTKMFSPLLLTWVEVFCGPQLAYYYYKANQFKKSIFQTKKSIKSIQFLKKEGYQYLFFSEIQQLHNLSRIYFKLEDEAKAVSLCTRCLSDIVNHSKNWEPGMLINGIPERKLIDITQYAMIIQVVTETCNRLLRKIRSNNLRVEKWLGLFLNHLAQLSFKSISTETRYSNLDTFSLLMKRFLDKGIDDIEESNLRFISANDTDKDLLRTLYSFASYLNRRENTTLIPAAI